jgi:hypothetical protein
VDEENMEHGKRMGKCLRERDKEDYEQEEYAKNEVSLI